MCNSCGDDDHVVKEEVPEGWVRGYDNWKKVLKNLRPETIIRPDEKDRSRSDDLAWIAPIDAIDLKDDQQIDSKLLLECTQREPRKAVRREGSSLLPACCSLTKRN